MSGTAPTSTATAEPSSEGATAPPAERGGGARAGPPAGEVRFSSGVLLASVFVIAVCGLIYQLLAATLSTYLLGSSVTQFSIVIGLFLTAMGIGSFLSRFVKGDLLRVFFAVEVLVGLAGGLQPLLLFFAFAALGSYTPLLVATSLLIGTLVGLEIPLLVRILRREGSLRIALGNVLALDYVGALAASLLFPLLLAPRLGLIRTGCLFGLLNVAVVLLGLHVFRQQIRRLRGLRWAAIMATALLAVGFGTAGGATRLLEDMLYEDPIVFTRSTPYQRLIVTRWRDDVRLFIDGNIQFSSVDEFRYHEALVHPAMGLAARPSRVLVLGGGDGLATREVLKHSAVERIDLVDIDPEMTRLFSSSPLLARLNEGSLSDRRVRIFNEDAQKFLERSRDIYDVVVIDLPDPNNETVGKLYTRSFYRLVGQHLAEAGAMVTQATSPFYATDAFWCIVNTLSASTLGRGGERLHVLPYHATVPSFGVWGFVIATRRPADPGEIPLLAPTRFLTSEILPSLFLFPRDIAARQTPVNRLDNQVLVRLYERGYRRYNR